MEKKPKKIMLEFIRIASGYASAPADQVKKPDVAKPSLDGRKLNQTQINRPGLQKPQDQLSNRNLPKKR
jgi:hypothetical protein